MSLLNGREQFAIISYYDCGPVFGRARNLCVFPEKRKCGYSYLGDTYQCPPGHQNIRSSQAVENSPSQTSRCLDFAIDK